jgi:hypothetical protein
MADFITPSGTAPSLYPANDDWKLRSNAVDQGDLTETLTRYAHPVHAADAAKIVAYLKASATVSTPYADHQAYTGTYATGRTINEGGDDRACTVSQELHLLRQLTKTTSGDLATELLAFRCLKTDDHNIEVPFAFPPAPGTSGAGNRILGESESKNLAFTWRNLDPANETKFYTITDADMVTKFGTGYVYVSREWKVLENNTATAMVIFAAKAWNSGTAIDDAMILEIVAEVDGNHARVRRIWPRRTLDAMTRLTTSSGAAVSDNKINSIDYTHESFVVQPHDDSAYSVIQTLVVPWLGTLPYIEKRLFNYKVDYTVPLTSIPGGVCIDTVECGTYVEVLALLTEAGITNLSGTHHRYVGMGRWSGYRVSDHA